MRVETEMNKRRKQTAPVLLASSLVIHSAFGIRHSDFVIVTIRRLNEVRPYHIYRL